MLNYLVERLGLTLCGLALLIEAQATHAITTSGVMKANETWSGVVTLTGDVTVPESVTLTILPGTTVECWDNTDDQVEGKDPNRIELIIDGGVLSAVGTAEKPILLTSSPSAPPAARGDWYGVRLTGGTNGVSTLSYATVEYGYVGISIEAGTAPQIQNCTARYNFSHGIYARLDTSLSGCAMVNNAGNGFLSEAGGTYTFTNCVVAANASAGIHIWTGNDANTLILNCYLTNNSGTGCWADGYVTVRSTEVSGNGGHGLVAQSVDARDCLFSKNQVAGACAARGVVVNCTADNNGTHGFWDAGARVYGFTFINCAANDNGVSGFAAASSVGENAPCILTNCVANGNREYGMVPSVGSTIVGCLVQNNGTGIYALSPGTIFSNAVVGNGIGILVYSGTTVTGITGNKIAGNNTYEIKNNCDSAVIATNNFWGTNMMAELANNVRNLTQVYDSQDDSSLGQIIVKPYLMEDPIRPPAAPISPSILAQPSDVERLLGQTAGFHVAASGDAPLSYQWYFGATALANGGRISGADTADLAISSVEYSDTNAAYWVKVSNQVGSTNSQIAALTIPVPPAIITNPVTHTVGLGNSATFTVDANGSTPLSYQWYFNGVEISGATEASYTLPITSAGLVGNYQVVVWNRAGTNWSTVAGLWLDTLKMYAGVNVYGPVSNKCEVQYTTNLTAPVVWTPLQSVTIVTNPMVIIDYTSPDHTKRFYRTVPQ